MPGYMIHLSVCNEEVRGDRAFILGVEAPDLLKKYLKQYGIEGVEEKYNNLKVDGMPNFSELKERVCQKESKDSNLGLHYGVSSSPDIVAFYSGLSEEQKNSSFYKGYLWHLLTDKIMYSKLKIEEKLEQNISAFMGMDKSAFIEFEKDRLHSDWDKTNFLIQERYGVELTPEVVELNVVGFINDSNLCYIDWEIIKNVIDSLRRINPLRVDMMDLIDMPID